MLYLIIFTLCLSNIFSIHSADRYIVLRHDKSEKTAYMLFEKTENSFDLPTDDMLRQKTTLMQDCLYLDKPEHVSHRVLLAHPENSALPDNSRCLWINVDDIRQTTGKHPNMKLLRNMIRHAIQLSKKGNDENSLLSVEE